MGSKLNDADILEFVSNQRDNLSKKCDWNFKTQLFIILVSLSIVFLKNGWLNNFLLYNYSGEAEKAEKAVAEVIPFIPIALLLLYIQLGYLLGAYYFNNRVLYKIINTSDYWQKNMAIGYSMLEPFVNGLVFSRSPKLFNLYKIVIWLLLTINHLIVYLFVGFIVHKELEGNVLVKILLYCIIMVIYMLLESHFIKMVDKPEEDKKTGKDKQTEAEIFLEENDMSIKQFGRFMIITDVIFLAFFIVAECAEFIKYECLFKQYL